MAHYAFLDENNVVTEVIVGKDETDTTHDWEQYYNGNYRKNYAGVGCTYDSTRDAFIHPKPYPSWTLNEDTCRWSAPTPKPTDGKLYKWNESTTSWVAV